MEPPPSTDVETVKLLADSPEMVEALESDRFKRFLDHLPVAVAVAELGGERELIVYANAEFEQLSGLGASQALEGKGWDTIAAEPVDPADGPPLASAIVEQDDYVGRFRTPAVDDGAAMIDVHSAVIHDDAGAERYRLVALVGVTPGAAEAQSLEARVRQMDTQLRELQHRVKNNLQMVTALIRMEARKAGGRDKTDFDRLAGRVGALALLYEALSLDYAHDEVDLGAYVGQIGTTLMAAHGVEGVRLDLSVDAYPVSLDIAMPTGLVVNELLTNVLKHAFVGRESGTITLHCRADDGGCRVVIADDGVGLPDGLTWPAPGRLGALIADSLKQNANANFEVASRRGEGTRITIQLDGAARGA